MNCDVASPESVGALAAEVEEEFGRCDILVNSAGIFKLQAFEDMSFADWRRTLSINLDCGVPDRSAFAPGMKQRGWGRIVNMASSTFGRHVGLRALHRQQGRHHRAHARARDRARPARRHRQRDRARAHAHARRHGARPARRRDRHGDDRSRSPPRAGDPARQVPADIVGTLSFLCSDDAAFITGQTLYVNGGLVRS